MSHIQPMISGPGSAIGKIHPKLNHFPLLPLQNSSPRYHRICCRILCNSLSAFIYSFYYVLPPSSPLKVASTKCKSLTTSLLKTWTANKTALGSAAYMIWLLPAAWPHFLSLSPLSKMFQERWFSAYPSNTPHWFPSMIPKIVLLLFSLFRFQFYDHPNKSNHQLF